MTELELLQIDLAVVRGHILAVDAEFKAAADYARRWIISPPELSARRSVLSFMHGMLADEKERLENEIKSRQ